MTTTTNNDKLTAIISLNQRVDNLAIRIATLQFIDQPPPLPVLVDSPLLLDACLRDIVKSNMTAIDLEGRDLSRDGALSLIQLYREGSDHVWLVDVTVLQAAAFEKPFERSPTSLRIWLESTWTRKIWYDCRNDCDALYHLYSIVPANVFDVSLLELILRQAFSPLDPSSNYVRGLARTMRELKIGLEANGTVDFKASGRELAGPQFERFEERPLQRELIEYAAKDVVVLFEVYNKLYDKLKSLGSEHSMPLSATSSESRPSLLFLTPATMYRTRLALAAPLRQSRSSSLLLSACRLSCRPSLATVPAVAARVGSYPSARTFSASTRARDEEVDGKPAPVLPLPPLFTCTPADSTRLTRLRNVGISAHIDSGKTTLTERILFYTGRISSIHEVRGRDAVGAKMDSMELEREKGITIQSAATFADWDVKESVVDELAGKYSINIIDTPGHVDFTIEVERALRVLDGAVLVLCAVSGVQSQTITVDRQMRRYNVPRLSFINKMDRAGANPERVLNQIRNKLRIKAAMVNIQMGEESNFNGVVDLVKWKAIYNEGEKGMNVTSGEIPAEFLEAAQAKRAELVETLAEVDDEIADAWLEEREITGEELAAAIRRATISLKFSPVFLGSALANKSVQSVLDGVCLYLPTPEQSPALALSVASPNDPPQTLTPTTDAPLVSLAFKLEEGRYGQLTYIRVYQGVLKKGSSITNVRTGKKVKVPRLVRMHSDEMEDVDSIGAGEICAMFGVECSSGDTFSDTPGGGGYSMTSMFVPEPVISLAIRPKGQETPNFSRALNRFQKEDPTFRVHVDAESQETIISGMGELHLDIYVERMKREYQVECVTGKPRVAFRETITEAVPFSYTHKKQSGGAGQYGKVVGRLEPMEIDEATGKDTAFESTVMGGNIPAAYIPAVQKGFNDALERGILTGHPISGCKFILEDGAAHQVDSSELAFRLAAQGAFKEAFTKGRPVVLEPVMKVDIVAPLEFQGAVIGGINQRKGTIADTEIRDEEFTLTAEVSLNDMFGYASQLRGMTQGKGEFTMEYLRHLPVMPGVQKEMQESFTKFAGGASSKK